MTNYDEYIKKIPEDIDKVLIKEAVKIIHCGQYRAAYILIWLACIESILERFKKLSLTDSVAKKFHDEITNISEGKQATDKIILTKAKEYGFIDAIEENKLKQIYENRCIYAHPYNQSPKLENVDSAFVDVIDIILAKTLYFTKNNIKQEISKLTNNMLYVANFPASIERHTEFLLKRIETDNLMLFIQGYFEKLDQYLTKSTKTEEVNLGINLLSVLLKKTDIAELPNADWHQITMKLKIVDSFILLEPVLFSKIGFDAQNTLLTKAKNLINRYLPVLNGIINLIKTKVLTTDQYNIIQQELNNLSLEVFANSDADLNFLYDRIISDLKSYNWYVQSPAILIIINKKSSLKDLPIDKQIELGRNVLQTANGGENEARAFLESQDIYSLPVDFLKGIIFEVFVNENNEIRYKERCIESVLSIINNMNTAERDTILEELIRTIERSNIKKEEYCSLEYLKKDNYLLKTEWGNKIILIIKEKLTTYNIDS
ncbi:MAG TPA: hypothetical protein H9673_06770 [Candidatus Adamsella sp.]|nr:hypothetical protein [Candidatus Adamsella sp.]